MKSFKIKYQENGRIHTKTVQRRSKEELGDIKNLIWAQEIKKEGLKGFSFKSKKDISGVISELWMPWRF